MTSTNIPQVDLGVTSPGNIRILHMHHNVPGVLSKIHAVLSDYGVNVNAQFLQSNSRHSYIILEVEPFHAKLVMRELKKIRETIFLRTIL
jgi:D-3-phosphoglycerate dehydrogenase